MPVRPVGFRKRKNANATPSQKGKAFPIFARGGNPIVRPGIAKHSKIGRFIHQNIHQDISPYQQHKEEEMEEEQLEDTGTEEIDDTEGADQPFWKNTPPWARPTIPVKQEDPEMVRERAIMAYWRRHPTLTREEAEAKATAPLAPVREIVSDTSGAVKRIIGKLQGKKEKKEKVEEDGDASAR